MSRFFSCCCLFLCLGLTGSAAGVAGSSGAFTLEEVLSAPFPSGLVTAPRAGSVAWVLNDRGVRNIWIAEPPEYEARALTSYTEDDGQELTSLAFTPGAERLVYVRGGGANRQGEFPNPWSDPEGTEQALWVVSTAGRGKEPRRLAAGHSPVVSPGGDEVVYLHQGQIHHVALDGKGEAEPSQLVKARGQATNVRFSPDGDKLAFVSRRDDHSFIGVLDGVRDPEGRRLRFLDPSVDLDRDPAWSPDGKEIAFVRIPSSSEIFTFGPRREAATPWSIRIVDVASGVGRELWRAEEGRGSVFHGVVAPSQLLWTTVERILFPWEKTGWLQLYSVTVETGLAVPLGQGPYEVEHVFLTQNGDEVLFSANKDDPHRRHIWRARARGGAATLLTPGDGLEWSPVETGDGKALAFLRSGAREPARAAIRVGEGEIRDLAPEQVPEEFPTDSLVVPQPVVFAAADGLEVPAQLFLPSERSQRGGQPAVVFLHGGSRRQMLLGWHYRQYYNFAYAFNQFLASRGYVVLSVNYRSGTGYGMEFREAIGYGAHGASEFNDVMGAGLYLQSRPEVDPRRLGLWGGSYGGYLTALGLARASDLFHAGVDLHGVHDWSGVIRNFNSSYDPLERPDMARRAFESSPLASISTWRAPVLLIHGDDDRNVPFEQTVRLVEALRKHEVEFEQLVFPDEVHGFLTHARWLTVYSAAATFFDFYLSLQELARREE